MASAGREGFYVSWEQVMAFFAMAEEALKAKTAANEALKEDADNLREELQEKRQAYIKVLRKEQALSEDSGFLKEQMEKLLKERLGFQERIAALERENRFLLQEREIMGQQLELDEREAEPEGRSALAATLRQRLEEERRRSEEAEAELDRQRAAAAGLGAALSRAEAVLAAKKAFWEEKEASLLRSLESANLAALTATRQALPALPHPLALRSLLSGVMSGATAVRENLVARTQGDSNRSRCLSPEGSAVRPASAGSRSSPAGRSATKPVPATLDKQSSAAASYRTPERKAPADKAAAAAALPTPEKRASADRPAGGKKAPSRGASVPLHADAATSGREALDGGSAQRKRSGEAPALRQDVQLRQLPGDSSPDKPISGGKVLVPLRPLSPQLQS
ncbi:g2723 [Coccomyxa elongata]